MIKLTKDDTLHKAIIEVDNLNEADAKTILDLRKKYGLKGFDVEIRKVQPNAKTSPQE